MRSLLQARFGDRVHIAAGSRVASGSPVRYVFHPEPGFVETVSAAQAMAKRHLPLRAAKAVVERLLDNEDVAIEIPKIEDAKSFERELARFGIKTVRLEISEPAEKPDLVRSR
ncbi:MAG TPA: hypothetical protein VGF07_00680 [Stellaceae bacterium]|jgi:hypothetical protein